MYLVPLMFFNEVLRMECQLPELLPCQANMLPCLRFAAWKALSRSGAPLNNTNWYGVSNLHRRK